MPINMAYCRFENTFRALRECVDSMDASDLSEFEHQARVKLIQECQRIASDFEGYDDRDFAELNKGGNDD